MAAAAAAEPGIPGGMLISGLAKTANKTTTQTAALNIVTIISNFQQL